MNFLQISEQYLHWGMYKMGQKKIWYERQQKKRNIRKKFSFEMKNKGDV